MTTDVLPEVEIGGLTVVRCAAQPSRFKDEQTHWTIRGFGFDDYEPHLILLGNLVIHSTSEFVGVTVEAQLAYPDTPPFSVDDRDAINAEVTRLGSWATHVMYDYAAITARHLIATTGFELEAPFLTPDVKIHVESVDDATDDDGDEETDVTEATPDTVASRDS